ncbi:MAG: hypothetical protein AB1523_03185 [Bacillota bacterium]
MGKCSRRKKILRIFAALLIAGVFLVLFFAGQKGEPAQNPLSQKQQEEILAIIEGGVEDSTWWGAKSKDELREILARYYTKPLLDKICADSWAFISEPTDWYWQAHVKKIELHRQAKDIVCAEVELALSDAITGQIETGKAEFTLKKTKEGWRIFTALYRWPG